jgi:CRP-like cAMP-binding protein
MSATTIPVEQLREVSIFRGLSDAEIQALLQGAERKQVAAGMPVFNEGDEVTGLYLIEAGKVVVRKRASGGTVKDLATLDAKHVFGEMGLLVGGRARTASVVALETATLWHIPRPRFAQLIEQGGAAVAKVTLNMARILAYRLDAQNKELARVVEVAGGGKKKTAELTAFKEKLDTEWSF